jgi:SNF2 family DNA or RNA helicase
VGPERTEELGPLCSQKGYVTCQATLVIVGSRGWTAPRLAWLKALVYHGPARRDSIGEVESHDIVLTTYSRLAKDHSLSREQETNLHDFEWYRVVLDDG